MTLSGVSCDVVHVGEVILDRGAEWQLHAAAGTEPRLGAIPCVRGDRAAHFVDEGERASRAALELVQAAHDVVDGEHAAIQSSGADGS